MSSLQRYRKPGGFVQLVSLIETFPPAKRDKFLEMIEAESPSWAGALKDKMLGLERMAAWPDDVLGKVLKALPLKSQAYALEGLDPALKVRLHATMSASERRRLDDILSENTPKSGELASVLVKMIEIARQMLTERDLSAEKFDATLVVAGDIEQKLDEVASPTGGAGGPAPVTGDAVALQRQLAQAVKENKALRDELRGLRDRLDQIRRIA